MKKEHFIGESSNWGSHRPLLWGALEATKHLMLPVLELGCGDNSTPFLRRYCEYFGLLLYSYDFNRAWADRFGAIHVTNWDSQVDWLREYSVCLIDESPGEHRKQSLVDVDAKIIVIHDSEPIGWNASDYQVRPLFNQFKYVKDHVSPKPNAWATALSNEFDVTKFEI